jgi:hypothetical protein
MSTTTTPPPAPTSRRARRALRKLDSYTLQVFNPAPPLTYPTRRDQL